MKKTLIALAAFAALSGCSDHADLKRSIVECKTAGELMQIDTTEAMIINLHSDVLQHHMHFELTLDEFKALRAQIFKEWRVDSLSEDERRAKAKPVFDSPQCRAMQS